ncbi:MAG: PocR ligand-binding domain-containing protein [Polyangiaceae bacterium]|nr:PocR ligand-binding domain-containing protein [Polyangiaceae bacterium]
MVESAQPPSLDALTIGRGAPLEELVDRAALGELVASFYELFRVPLRIFNAEGRILADASHPEPLYVYLDSLRRARRVLAEEISAVKSVDPGVGGDAIYPSVTGSAYRIVSIAYDGRQLGRMIFGPFLPLAIRELPETLLALDPDLDVGEVRILLAKMPRARQETVGQIANHLLRTLDLILFSGHKALLTSKMHLASIRESYRELEVKSQRLQEAYDRLKELDRLKSNFLATVSHELRTPLTSIIGYGEMLSEGIAGELTTDQADFVATIREKGEQLLGLIKGLLDLSKLESGTMRVSRELVDMATVIADVQLTLAPTARKKGVTFEATVPAGRYFVWGDGERLRQVFLNLAENAIKFTPAAGTVTVSASDGTLDAGDGDDSGHVLFTGVRPAVEVRVTDTGIGIPESERLRVFDTFYQIDSSSTREQGGTGLGLSIVKKLVEGHAGRIWIEGNDPSGAVFAVLLPTQQGRAG